MTAHSLLSWAVNFVRRETDCLEECHAWPDGSIRDYAAAEDIRDARRWLAEAELELAANLTTSGENQ